MISSKAITPAEIRYQKVSAFRAYLEGDREIIPLILDSLDDNALWKLKDDAEQLAIFAEEAWNERLT